MPPSHTRENDSESRAPYNFVSLDDKVILVTDQPGVGTEPAVALPDHSRFYPETEDNQSRYTGYFDVTLTTESPVYVRGMLTADEAAVRDSYKNKPDFFNIEGADHPVIPASTLRGMTRSLVEIITLSQMSRMSEKQLFFRTVDTSAIGDTYRERMGNDKVEGGFLACIGGEWRITTTRVLRIGRSLLDNRIYEGRAPNKTPTWTSPTWHQYMRVWVRAVSGWEVDDIQPRNPNRADYQAGVLVITGDMPGKKREFVFLLPSANQESIPVEQAMIDRFHDDDQITQFQQNAFPVDKPSKGARAKKGGLRKDAPTPGDPVFFLRESDDDGEMALTFFGRARMFRLPYNNSPTALRPSDHSDENVQHIDLADAIFGFVLPEKRLDDQSRYQQGDKIGSYSGRVRFHDATMTNAPDGIYDTDAAIRPPILSTPKPTTFQHYLRQKPGTNARQLNHYDSGEARLSGRKLYWRAALQSTQALDQSGRTDVDWTKDTQHTRLRAVKAGVTFQFRIDFENLTAIELGALAWALTLPQVPGGRHMLGMGKPFGMGIARLDAQLTLSNRTTRYTTLFDGDGWATGETRADERLSTLIEAFTTFVGQQKRQPFTALQSIQELSAMLRLRERNPERETQTGRAIDIRFDYGIIDSDSRVNDYYGRPLLPNPIAVASADDSRMAARQQAAADRQRREQQEQQAALGYQSGMELKGEVTEIDGDVFFDIRKPLPGMWFALIRAQDLGRRQYQVGNKINVVILAAELDGDGETMILYCGPAS